MKVSPSVHWYLNGNQANWSTAHHIRNRTAQTFKAACAIAARYRWCLTGTPIHNSLDDYGALLTFVGVSPFCEKSMFDYWISSPIRSKEGDGFKRLQALVKATCLRRTKAMIGHSFDLPQRIEKIEYIALHPTDQELYNFFKTKTANIANKAISFNTGGVKPDTLKENNILVLINFLRLICNHGKDLLPQSALEAWRAGDSTSFDWQTMRGFGKRCEACERGIEMDTLPSACGHLICATCIIQQEQSTPEEEIKCRKCVMMLEDGKNRSRNVTPLTPILPSAKIEALLRNLRSEQSPERYQRKGSPTKRFTVPVS